MGDRCPVFAKQWPLVLAEDRTSKEGNPFVEFKRGNNADQNDISIFFHENDDPVVEGEYKDVEDLCHGFSVDAISLGEGFAGSYRGAWLDDRSFPCNGRAGGFRDYQNPLSATGLYRALNEQVFLEVGTTEHKS